MTLVERLRALRHEIELRWSGAYAENMVNTVATAADRIEQLEAALQFYADNASYCQLYIPGVPLSDPRTFAPVLQDDGKRARDALAALEQS